MGSRTLGQSAKGLSGPARRLRELLSQGRGVESRECRRHATAGDTRGCRGQQALRLHQLEHRRVSGRGGDSQAPGHRGLENKAAVPKVGKGSAMALGQKSTEPAAGSLGASRCRQGLKGHEGVRGAQEAFPGGEVRGMGHV